MLKTRPRKTMANRTAKLSAARRMVTVPRFAGCQVCLGYLVGWNDRGPLVDFEGNTRGPVHARQAGQALRARPAALGALRQEFVLLVDPRAIIPAADHDIWEIGVRKCATLEIAEDSDGGLPLAQVGHVALRFSERRA